MAVRPEQISFVDGTKPGSFPVKIYANQPAGSETLISLQAGDSTFIAKSIGVVHYDIDQAVNIYIDPDKMNVYDAKSTNLIKRAVV